MKKSIGGLVVCLLGLAACNVEHYDDCNTDDFDSDGFGGSHSLPSKPSSSGKGSTDGGSASGSGAAAGSTATGGGSASEGGASGAPPVVVPPDTCEKERDCKPGFNCDLETNECLPAAEETCGELETEAACTHRSDCTPIYGGTNCSCGQDCECKGGEPGCVCESFEFFVCHAAE